MHKQFSSNNQESPTITEKNSEVLIRVSYRFWKEEEALIDLS